MQRQGLYRSRTDRVIGGVAAGIARSLNIDSAVVRIIFALLIIFGGGGLLLYLVLWIAIPEEPLQFYQQKAEGSEPETATETDSAEPTYTQEEYPSRGNSGALIAGLVLIALGALFLVNRFLPYLHIHFRDFWPLLLVIAGIVLIYSSFTGQKKS
jgi:phage shock protein C